MVGVSLVLEFSPPEYAKCFRQSGKPCGAVVYQTDEVRHSCRGVRY